MPLLKIVNLVNYTKINVNKTNPQRRDTFQGRVARSKYSAIKKSWGEHCLRTTDQES